MVKIGVLVSQSIVKRYYFTSHGDYDKMRNIGFILINKRR